MSDMNALISQYDVRPGQVYLSGAHVITAQVGPFGVPYWGTGLAIQTTKVALYSAPEPYRNDIQYRVAQQTYTTPVMGTGQAPTSGVYTGVVDDCH